MNHNAAIDCLIPGRNSQCPCGSAKKAKNCCLISKKVFIKKPIELLVKDNSKTNYANDSCIASFTNDCVKKITGEHYFSRSLLKLIDSAKVEINGWPHGKSKLATIPIDSLVVNCLCERHNNMLSPFDDTASMFFKTLIDFNSAISKGIVIQNRYRLFNYWDFERWMIKTLVMASEAGFSQSNGMTQKLSQSLKREYLKILFENDTLAIPGAGFYFTNEHNEQIRFSNTFDFSANTSTLTNELEGCTTSFGGFKFVFSPRKLLHIEGIPTKENQFRPWRLVYGEGLNQMIIDFSVKDGSNLTFQLSAKSSSRLPAES